jgi:hypothetical protein
MDYKLMRLNAVLQYAQHVTVQSSYKEVSRLGIYGNEYYARLACDIVGRKALFSVLLQKRLNFHNRLSQRGIHYLGK